MSNSIKLIPLTDDLGVGPDEYSMYIENSPQFVFVDINERVMELKEVYENAHPRNDEHDAKIWLEPVIEIAHPGRTLKKHELTRALKIVEQNRKFLMEEWYAYTNKAS